MSKELIEALRAGQAALVEFGVAGKRSLYADAADEIERLQAQWDNSEQEWAGLVEDWTQKLKRVAALEAENAELKAERNGDLKGRLDALSDDQRLELFGRYCAHCGCKQPESGMRCQCWNDE